MPDLRSVRLTAPLSFTRDQMSLRPRTGSENAPDSTQPMQSCLQTNLIGVCRSFCGKSAQIR